MCVGVDEPAAPSPPSDETSEEAAAARIVMVEVAAIQNKKHSKQADVLIMVNPES